MKELSTKLVLCAFLFYQTRASICDIVQCRNEGVCIEEEPDFSGHHFVEDEHVQELYGRGTSPFYCQCSSNWTGHLCDIPFDKCSISQLCYNGGTCISDSTDVCDCTTATNNGYKYEGKYCEHKVSTVEEHSSGSFKDCPCLNNGTCCNRPDLSHACHCPSGFTGRFCEFDKNTVPTCDLECSNGGYCVFSSNENERTARRICQCPEGFVGEFCEISAVPCGDALCYHGSTCVSEPVSDNVMANHCDCRNAESANGKRYAGMLCQYEETADCGTTQNMESRLFCVNNGQCKDQGHLGCDCPGGFTGFSCEFYVGENLFGAEPHIEDVPVEDVPECNLDCGGHGTCRYGMKDTSGLGGAANADGLSETHDNLQHCVCEEGFAGIYCDRVIKKCGDSHLLCLNGASCGADRSGSPYCDCTTATGIGKERFYGDSCEFLITSTCSLGAREGAHVDSDAFCVNNGTCKRTVENNEDHPGCDCPDGWAGAHCEEQSMDNSVCSVGGSLSDDSSHVCHNGGTCQSIVARGMSHPGCRCTEGWTGLRCDIPRPASSSRRPKKKAALLFPITMILVSLAVIATFAIKLISHYWQSTKEVPHQILWPTGAPPDADDDDAMNLAPKRDDSSEEKDHAVVEPTNSSRDPMTLFLACRSKVALSRNGRQGDSELYFGPNLDEDGFPLHNVDII